MKKYTTYSEKETENFAYEFASKLKKDSVIVLTGNLGTGKTRFMRGIAKYFGIENEVSSPTFTIVNEYTPKENIGVTDKIFHFDTYRLQDSIDFENSIGTHYFDEGICILEWGEIVSDILPDNAIYITIKAENEANPCERTIYITEDIL